MSLILEALRKSEAERRRGLAPDLAMELPPTQTARPRPPAAWLLPALVVAALLVLASWWVRREPAMAASPHAALEGTTDTTPATAGRAPDLLPRIEPMPAAPALASAPAPEIQMPGVPAPSPAAVAPAPVAAATAISAASATVTPPMPIQPAPARPLPSPSASDLGNDTPVLSTIKLSMHMWDDVPAKRFVILNGQRMAEGDSYGGVAVVAIERNGVVVESNGNRARVPLP